MSIEYAMNVLTDPSPNARQQLVLFLAERCHLRARANFGPRIDDCLYIIAICLRLGAITKLDMPNLSRLALGRLAQDVNDTWALLVQNAL